MIEFAPGPDELAKVLDFYDLLEPEASYKIICPFHDEIYPSMLVDLEKGKYFCFGCYSVGNAYDFVKQANKNLDDLSSIRLYFQILNNSKKKGFISANRNVKPKTTYSDKQLFIEAKDYYFNLKTVDWTNLNSKERLYFERRNITAEMLNFCKAKPTYNESYPVIFPIFDSGNFKGWVCRAINKSIEKKRKYLYNKGFRRKETLLGDYSGKTVVLTEGYFDWLKLKSFGVKNVAAILGWKISPQQIVKLKEKGVENIISALDNDKAGKRGSQYLQQFFNVTEFSYPENVKDPGELTKEQFLKAKERTNKRRIYSCGKLTKAAV